MTTVNCGGTRAALAGRNLIQPTDIFPKQAKDFNWHLVEPFNEVMDFPLHGHANAMNSFEELEDPTLGWSRSQLIDLIG